jgi:hypothetical protein
MTLLWILLFKESLMVLPYSSLLSTGLERGLLHNSEYVTEQCDSM